MLLKNEYRVEFIGYILRLICECFSSMDKMTLSMDICFIYRWAHLFVNPSYLSGKKDLLQIS